jgi:hypothetical protein
LRLDGRGAAAVVPALADACGIRDQEAVAVCELAESSFPFGDLRRAAAAVKDEHQGSRRVAQPGRNVQVVGASQAAGLERAVDRAMSGSGW